MADCRDTPLGPISMLKGNAMALALALRKDIGLLNKGIFADSRYVRVLLAGGVGRAVGAGQ